MTYSTKRPKPEPASTSCRHRLWNIRRASARYPLAPYSSLAENRAGGRETPADHRWDKLPRRPAPGAATKLLASSLHRVWHRQLTGGTAREPRIRIGHKTDTTSYPGTLGHQLPCPAAILGCKQAAQPKIRAADQAQVRAERPGNRSGPRRQQGAIRDAVPGS